ncbi:MAG: PAS domain-containing protein [Rubrivivax sp.]|nr:PAS domain-containing protein [Rubrivivax sp.]
MAPTPHRTRWLARLNPRVILTAGVTLALSLGVGAVVASVVLWRDMVAESESDVRRLVRLLAEHAARTIEPVDRAMLAVQQGLEKEGYGYTRIAPERIRELARSKALAGTQLLRLVVSDADGWLVAMSDRDELPRPMRITDPWFEALRKRPPAELVFNPPQVSRITGEPVVPLARAIVDPASGAYLGAVTAALDPAELQQFYEAARVTPEWTLALLRNDGALLSHTQADARWPTLVGLLGTGATELVRWGADPDGRLLLGLRRVGHWPLVAAVSVESELVVAAWRQRILAMASFTVPAAAGVLLLAWLGALSAQRSRGLSHTLDVAEARYQALVDSSPDGILLATEGVVQYANRAMLRLAGADTPAGLVGRRVDELLDGTERYHRSAEFDGPPQDQVVRIEHFLRPLAGPVLPVETLIAGAPPGGDRTLQIVVRDISARKRLEHQLEASRREVESLAMAAEMAREREKRRIARELHDELGQVLTVQQLDVEMLAVEAASRPELAQRIDALRSRIDDALAVTRRISGDLRPLVLDDLGLVAGLEWLVGQAGTHGGLEGRLEVHGDPQRISDDVSTTLFRIAQESLTNVMRHAQARHVQVALAADDEGVELTVTDDGRGIEQPRRRRGLGLRGIAERVRLLGGRFDVADSAQGGGTRVAVRLPLRVLPAEATDSAPQELRA